MNYYSRMNKKIIYTTKYQMPTQNMVRFYQTPVHNTMEYIPNFPRTGGQEFSSGRFNQNQYQNAITRDSLILQNYIDNNWWYRNFGAGNQGHASTAGSPSGNLQLNREWLHKLKGYDDSDTREAADRLNKYQQPNLPYTPNQMVKSPPQRTLRMDENKYSLHRQPAVRQYQDTTYSVSGGDTALDLTDYSAQSPASNQYGSGGMNSNQLAGYANMVNFGINAFSDPTKGMNTNPNANLQTTLTGPTDAPISTLADDAPITFSENYAGNSMGINQLDYQDYQNIINGTVPADAGAGGMIAGGAQGAMTGLAAGGPVGAIIGFAVGAGGSMYKDSKNEEARAEIRESLTAQNQEVLGSSTVAMKKANDAELARFLV